MNAIVTFIPNPFITRSLLSSWRTSAEGSSTQRSFTLWEGQSMEEIKCAPAPPPRWGWIVELGLVCIILSLLKISQSQSTNLHFWKLKDRSQRSLAGKLYNRYIQFLFLQVPTSTFACTFFIVCFCPRKPRIYRNSRRPLYRTGEIISASSLHFPQQ